jgi:glucose/mannose transport system substrate-binding protein
MALSRDTIGQIEDLMVQFWNDSSMSAADAQAKYASIIASAD